MFNFDTALLLKTIGMVVVGIGAPLLVLFLAIRLFKGNES